MVELVIIGLGGFVGAIARYGLSGLVHRYWQVTFPVGTLVVNVLGCLVIGVFIGLVEERQLFGDRARAFIQFGLLGSFTTFSTFGYDTLQLLRAEEWSSATMNVLANVLLGIGAVALGVILVRTFAT